jgi:FAD-dependent oxidoreductase domain-containing protein 1
MSSPQILIIGGGVMGCATAFFLARDHGLIATVIERDTTYSRASSSLSASSIRMQFSQPINIALSQWSLAFLKRVQDELRIGDDSPHIGLTLPGYLYLATESGAHTLRSNHAAQMTAGAGVELLEPALLQQRFAWMQVQDIALGAHGPGVEGWFDGPALHQAFRRKAASLGVRFVAGEVQGFKVQADRVKAVVLGGGEQLATDQLVLCAGAWSGALAAKLGVHLPVVPRKRDVFMFDSPAQLPGCPLVIDPSGLWFRAEGTGFLCGAPPRGEDADEPPLSNIDHALFDEMLWPRLAHRVPGFEALRLRSAWAGYYEMNLFDHNGLAGPLPGLHNAHTACGFSGHGMQQAPAVGCGLAAQIAQQYSSKTTPNAPVLNALSPARIELGKPLVEQNVI